MTLMELMKSPKGAALVCMASASALHFAAYECSRSATIAMFTSQKTGFESDAALPFATGCISPFSVLLLWMYNTILEKCGPRIALRNSTLLCTVNLVVGGLIMKYSESRIEESAVIQSLSRACIFCLFVSQNAFVQLLFTQHWAFLGSLGQGKKEGSAWFAPVAGIGSLSSTLAASTVGPMAEMLSLPGLLLFSALVVGLSGVAAELAYAMAEKNGFDPHQERLAQKRNLKTEKPRSLLTKTRNLFQRVKQTVTDDQERARWTGNCYALINGVSGLLQFCIIPIMVRYLDPRRLWAGMPLMMLLFTLYMSMEEEQHLAIVAAAFCTMKTLEYSLRGVSNEMLFASLDYESRYVAKQEIGLLANRFSKSFTAIGLSLLSKYVTDPSQLQGILSQTASITATLWLVASHQLTKMIFSKDKKL